MELKRNQLVFSVLQKGDSKKLREDGFIVRDKKEHWRAQKVASFSIESEEGIFDIHLIQIGIEYPLLHQSGALRFQRILQLYLQLVLLRLRVTHLFQLLRRHRCVLLVRVRHDINLHFLTPFTPAFSLPQSNR